MVVGLTASIIGAPLLLLPALQITMGDTRPEDGMQVVNVRAVHVDVKVKVTVFIKALAFAAGLNS